MSFLVMINNIEYYLGMILDYQYFFGLDLLTSSPDFGVFPSLPTLRKAPGQKVSYLVKMLCLVKNSIQSNECY